MSFERNITLAVPGTNMVAPEAFKAVETTLLEQGDLDYLALTADILNNPDALREQAMRKIGDHPQVTILGLSMGGLVAMTVAKQLQNHFDMRLILGDVPSGIEHLNPQEKRMMQMLRERPELAARMVKIHALTGKTQQNFSLTDMSAQLLHSANYPFEETAASLSSVPVVDIRSKQDERVPYRANAEKFKQHVPHALRILISDSPHVGLEEEGDRWNEALETSYTILGQPHSDQITIC